jgi:hypothetical protein
MYIIFSNKIWAYFRTTNAEFEFDKETKHNWTDKGFYISNIPIPPNSGHSFCVTFDPQEPYPAGYNKKVRGTSFNL